MVFSGQSKHVLEFENQYSTRRGDSLLFDFLLQWDQHCAPSMKDIINWIEPFDNISFMKDVRAVERSFLWSKGIYATRLFAIHLKIPKILSDSISKCSVNYQRQLFGYNSTVDIQAKCGAAFGKEMTEISIIAKGIPPSGRNFRKMLKHFLLSLGVEQLREVRYSAAKCSYEGFYNDDFAAEGARGFNISFHSQLRNDLVLQDIETYYLDCLEQVMMKMIKTGRDELIEGKIKNLLHQDDEKFKSRTCPCHHFLCSGSSNFLKSPLCFLPIV